MIKDLFYKPLKIKGDPNNILLQGCLHYNHDPVWENPIWNQRGYKSAKDHNEGRINNWNAKADQDSIGILLGDNFFGQGGAEGFKNLLRRLNFKTLYLCAGNHFAGFWQLLNECKENIYEFENKTVIFCPNYFEAFINGKPVVCSHYPVLSWNGQSKGSYMLFAHVHGRLKDSKVGRMYLESGAKCLEVSVEVNPFPLTFTEITRILEKREPVSFDHHGKDTKNPF